MCAPRFIISSAVALAVSLAAFAPPAEARDDVARVLVDIADVAIRGGVPYYRHGGYHAHDRLVVVRDHHGHPRYYRTSYRDNRYDRGYGQGYAQGHGYGYGAERGHHAQGHDRRGGDHGRGHGRSDDHKRNRDDERRDHDDHGRSRRGGHG